MPLGDMTYNNTQPVEWWAIKRPITHPHIVGYTPSEWDALRARAAKAENKVITLTRDVDRLLEQNLKLARVRYDDLDKNFGVAEAAEMRKIAGEDQWLYTTEADERLKAALTRANVREAQALIQKQEIESKLKLEREKVAGLEEIIKNLEAGAIKDLKAENVALKQERDDAKADARNADLRAQSAVRARDDLKKQVELLQAALGLPTGNPPSQAKAEVFNRIQIEEMVRELKEDIRKALNSR